MRALRTAALFAGMRIQMYAKENRVIDIESIVEAAF